MQENFNRIKELRQRKKMTQQELADFLCLDKTTVSKWETFKNLPNQNIQNSLCQLFGVSLDYLLGRKNDNVENELSKGIDPRLVKLIKESDISFESLNNIDDKKAKLIIDMIQGLIDDKK